MRSCSGCTRSGKPCAPTSVARWPRRWRGPTRPLSQVTAYNRDILPLTRQDEAFAQDAYQSGQTGIDVLILALQRSRDRRMAGLQSLLDYYLALADLERAIRGPVR